MEKQKGTAQEKVNLEYGICFHCNRIMPVKYLIQIRLYDHKLVGKFHHKLLCCGCKEAADQIYNHVDLEE